MQIISYYFGVNGKPRFLSMSLYMKLHTVVKSTVLYIHVQNRESQYIVTHFALSQLVLITLNSIKKLANGTYKKCHTEPLVVCQADRRRLTFISE